MSEFRRLDRYKLLIDGVCVTATTNQEQRIRAMTPEQRANFVALFTPKENADDRP